MKNLLKNLKSIETILFYFLIPAILYTNYKIFIVVPNEKIMGAVQRIFYFHVSSAIAAYLSIAIVFFASCFYLAKNEEIYNILNKVAGEVSFVFCSIVLFSGMIWGQAAWNTWFRFEPRLVTFLLIWLIFLTFNILKFFSNDSKLASHRAILGILGAITVPIMVYSIKLLPEVAQIHPQVVEQQGGLDPLMKETLFITMASLVLLQVFLIVIRLRVSLITYSLKR